MENSLVPLNLTVLSMGLDINDNRVSNDAMQPIVLLNSDIDISGVTDTIYALNALNLKVNTSKSNITIDNSKFKTNREIIN